MQPYKAGLHRTLRFRLILRKKTRIPKYAGFNHLIISTLIINYAVATNPVTPVVLKASVVPASKYPTITTA